MNDNMGPGFPTPLSTPDTPHGSCLSLLAKDKMKAGTNQILVSVLSPLKSRSLEEGAGAEAGGGGLGEDSCGQDSSGMPTITLEVRTVNKPSGNITVPLQQYQYILMESKDKPPHNLTRAFPSILLLS